MKVSGRLAFSPRIAGGLPAALGGSTADFLTIVTELRRREKKRKMRIAAGKIAVE